MKNINNTYHNHKYSDMEDEDIVDLVHLGESEALDFLIHKYKRLVQSKSRSYFLIGADREDIFQEGMIGLFKGIRDYKKEKLTTFKSFADLCITRQIISAIKTATRQKHIPLNSYISLDKPLSFEESGRTLMDTVVEPKAIDPEDVIISKEESNNIEVKISEMLSDLEREVLFLYLDGQTYKEISGELNSHVKAIDNALTRIKRKLEKYLTSNESMIEDQNDYRKFYNYKT